MQPFSVAISLSGISKSSPGWTLGPTDGRNATGEICRQTMPADHLLSLVVAWLLELRMKAHSYRLFMIID